ncbi:MAG TPA: DUF2935 domain-containing protein [Desulfitobacterium dehalogenans]|uniref:DUF2935 domain-containing protein n=1 Tax=Desulfitobacterium dehalogenans TaxID=36854 RepID=A0A7C7D7L4_9FIRM|nr:DUF2935 domain-containing protein [Desulfitobacterium dehalogenans]
MLFNSGITDGLLPTNVFIRQSLNLNLFFLRIMKEHSFFLAAGFLSKDEALSQQAIHFMNSFNALLTEAVLLANGNVDSAVLCSGEVATNMTLRAEQKTQGLGGVPLDTSLTVQELRLVPAAENVNPAIEGNVQSLNERAIVLTRELVKFKTQVLDAMLSGRLFTFNFPLLIVHIRREALLFIEQLRLLQKRGAIDLTQEVICQKVFWDLQMAEHAQFIAHLLDPTEAALIDQANNFARLFFNLRAQTESGANPLGQLIGQEIAATSNLRNFKATAEELILANRIKSIIFPLLADHLLREANHFLRILDTSGRVFGLKNELSGQLIRTPSLF